MNEAGRFNPPVHSENNENIEGLGRLVRAKKIAPFTGVSERCLTNWFHRGLIPGYQVGTTILFDIYEVLAAIKKGGRP
jgi:hypothetical protein